MSRWLLVGTYTSRESAGIYRVAVGADGSLGRTELAATTTNPSFLALHPSGRFVYAVNELWEFEGRPGGGVTAFALDAAMGALDPIGAAFSQGADPCHLTFDASRRFLLVANASAGNVAVLPVREDGRIEQASDVVEHSGRGPHPRRQTEPHVQAVAAMPGTPFVVAADLGTDQLVVYAFDAANGTLRRHGHADAPPGAGPRTLVLHGDTLFAVNELDSTVSAYGWDAANGELSLATTAPALPEGWEGRSTAIGLAIDAAGRWLYASNCGHDSIAAFRIEPAELTAARHTATGRKPRALAAVPGTDLLLAACEDADMVASYRVDAASGGLALVATTRVPTPAALLVL